MTIHMHLTACKSTVVILEIHSTSLCNKIQWISTPLAWNLPFLMCPCMRSIGNSWTLVLWVSCKRHIFKKNYSCDSIAYV